MPSQTKKKKVPGDVRGRLIDVLGGIYRSDAGAVVDALVALFGETFLAGMPLADLPTHFL